MSLVHFVYNTKHTIIVCMYMYIQYTVYPKKYAHGFVVLCFVVVMQSLIMNSHEVFIHIHQGCFAGTGAVVRLPQCQWSKPDGYGKISQCITITKHSKAKPCAYFLGYSVCNEYSYPNILSEDGIDAGTFANTLIHLPLEKMAAILADDMFKCILLNEKVRILIKISPKFVPMGLIDNNQALV